MRKTLLALLLASSSSAQIQAPISVAPITGFNFSNKFYKFSEGIQKAQDNFDLDETIRRTDFYRGFELYHRMEFSKSSLEYHAEITCNSCPSLNLDRYIPLAIPTFSSGPQYGITTEFYLKVNYVTFNFDGEEHKLTFDEDRNTLVYDGPENHEADLKNWFDDKVKTQLRKLAVKYRNNKLR